MSAFTIYVPGHVGRSSIQSCPLDAYSTFVDIDSEAFDIEAKLREHGCFIMLDNDYFVAYQKQHPEGVKCNYRSRNVVMSQMRYGDMFRAGFGMLQKEDSGVWTYEQLPVLYFVFRPTAQILLPERILHDNTIAEFYDTVEEEDFEKFAQVARSKANLCVSHLFVVNRASEYHVFDTCDPRVRVSYTSSSYIRYEIMEDLLTKKATIQEYIEKVKNIEKCRPPAERDPNFQLRDNKGVALGENETFMLEICKPEYEDDEDNYEREPDYLDVFGGSSCHAVISGSVEIGADFGFKVVDGITYLTHDGWYMCIDSEESSSPGVTVSAEIPPKERRIHIHYAEDGNILMSGWNSDTYVFCEWVKSSCGVVYVTASDEAVLRGGPMKLAVIRGQGSE
ncbi:hypothetical protein FB645_002872 [Coemansia sp. IMI 203386]|nr:hypothetical protein FB645_002872 [Coemansia sp. IMI 203386]